MGAPARSRPGARAVTDPTQPRRQDRSRARTIIGTIEVLAVGVVVIALVVFAIWFLFFAHNPLLRP